MDVSRYPAGSSSELNRLHRQLFDALDRDRDGRIWTWELYSALGRTGVLPGDPRIQSALGGLQSPDRRPMPVESRQPVQISFPQFAEIAQSGDAVVRRALEGSLVVQNFETLTGDISRMHDELLEVTSGKVADYIPRLAEVDPDQLAIAICTVGGQQFSVGKAGEPTCLQSVCKPFAYAMAVEEHGVEFVHTKVGQEQSGGAFNELVLDKLGRPHNPMINAGAMVSASLIKPGDDLSDRFDHVASTWGRLMAARPGFDNATYLSEKDTGFRNYALAAEMRNKGVLPPDISPEKAAEFYFQQCSIEVNASMLAAAAGTMANGGTNPFTNDQVFRADTVRNTLSQMMSSGMYDRSGELLREIGEPLKSGVSGLVIMVVPGVMGVCAWSPRLDEYGNSVRGIEFAKMFGAEYALHVFETPGGAKKDLRGRETGTGVAVPAAAVSRSGAPGAHRRPESERTVLDAAAAAFGGLPGPASRPENTTGQGGGQGGGTQSSQQRLGQAKPSGQEW
jgi:glutaminase